MNPIQSFVSHRRGLLIRCCLRTADSLIHSSEFADCRVVLCRFVMLLFGRSTSTTVPEGGPIRQQALHGGIDGYPKRLPGRGFASLERASVAWLPLIVAAMFAMHCFGTDVVVFVSHYFRFMRPSTWHLARQASTALHLTFLCQTNNAFTTPPTLIRSSLCGDGLRSACGDSRGHGGNFIRRRAPNALDSHNNSSRRW